MEENLEPAPDPEATTKKPIPKSTSESTPEPTLEPVSESTVEIGSVYYETLAYPYDGTIFSGDGTYYGETSDGNCAIHSIPSMYNDMIPGK